MPSASALERLRIDALAHENFMVRSRALDFWSREPDVPVAVTGRVLDAIESFGAAEAFRYLHQLNDLPHDERSWAWLTGRFEALRDGTHRDAAASISSNDAGHLARWFSRGPIEWIARDIDRFIDIRPDRARLRGGLDKGFADRGFNHAWSRIQIAELDAGGRLAALDERLLGCARTDGFAGGLVFEIEQLADEIGCRREIDGPTLAAWMTASADAPDDPAAGYRGGAALLIMTAAKGALEVPLNPILRLLAQDWDWTNELVQSALIAAADPAMMESLIDRYPDLEWFEPLFVSSVIERRRFPGLEPHLIRLLDHLPEDEDLMPVTSLAMGAVWYGDEASVDAARRIAETIHDAGDGATLHDALWLHEVLTCGLKGDALARAGRMHEDWKRVEARMRMLDSYVPRMTRDHPDTHVRDAPKIGRNDPCPCGSGKKYKKCCG